MGQSLSSGRSSSIAPELCEEIIAHLEEPKITDLKACSLVSKEWRSHCIGHLFTSIILPSPVCSQVEWKNFKHSLRPDEQAQLEEKAIQNLTEATQLGGSLSITSGFLPSVQNLTFDFMLSVDFLNKALPLIRQIPFAPNQIRGIALAHAVMPGSPDFVSYFSQLLVNNNDSIEYLSLCNIMLSAQGLPDSLKHVQKVIHDMFPPLLKLDHLCIGDMDLDPALDGDSYMGPIEFLADTIRPRPKTLTLDVLNELGYGISFGLLLYSESERPMFDCSRVEELRSTHYVFSVFPGDGSSSWGDSIRKVQIRVGRKKGAASTCLHRCLNLLYGYNNMSTGFLVFAPSEADYRRDPAIVSSLPLGLPDLTHITALLELDYYRVNQFIRRLPDISGLAHLQVLKIQIRVASTRWVEDRGWDWDSLEPNLVDVAQDPWESLRMRLVRLDESLNLLVEKAVSTSLNKIIVTLKIKGTPLDSPNVAELCFPFMMASGLFTLELH
ncbi:hypothetical protein D9758_007677 [Tetrapyrgos nigripes]|uniref:F-box domain-containing protein n=1 Tax=Tetrapyrgos nigripes TaxID=182062 RepID=A0A8H5LIR1_9AGAR|nr:hypothetical protein D9758_007677 [Tetrapyrgos nigripes]